MPRPYYASGLSTLGPTPGVLHLLMRSWKDSRGSTRGLKEVGVPYREMLLLICFSVR